MMKNVMTSLDGDCEEAEKIVGLLVSERYIDDLRYASAFARDKASLAGWGEVKIRYMLSSKGISKDVISRALEEIDQNKAGERLEKLMENKLRSLKDDPQARVKLLRLGPGRGHSYDEGSSVAEELLR